MDLTATALELVRLYGPLALAVFTFLETSLLFPLLPSEVVVPAAAAILVVDGPSLLAFVAAATVGSTVGSLLPYELARGPGSRGLSWLADAVDPDSAAVERAGRWFHRWGESSVCWGRLLPGLRSFVSVPAGLAGMSRPRFVAYTALGSLAFYASVGALVYYGRRQPLFVALWTAAVERPVVALGVALLAVGLALFGRRWYRRREREGP